MSYRRLVLTLTTVFGMNWAQAESTTMDQVRLFNSFFQDAAVVDKPYIEGGVSYVDFDNGGVVPFGARGGLPVFSQFDVGAALAGIHVDPDRGDGETGLSDLTLVGRYHLTEFKPVNVTTGMRFDVPTGDEDVGQDTLEYEAFAAIRYPLENLVLTGRFGLGYVETKKLKLKFSTVPSGGGSDQVILVPFQTNPLIGVPGVSLGIPFLVPVPIGANPDGGNVVVPTGFSIEDDGGFALFLSAGAIYRLTDKFHLIGEFSGDTKRDVGFFSGGIDYELIPNGRIRIAFGAAFGDERSANFTFQSGFLYSFGEHF